MCVKPKSLLFLFFLLLFSPARAELGLFVPRGTELSETLALAWRLCDKPRLVTESYAISITGRIEGQVSQTGTVVFVLKKARSMDCSLHTGSTRHTTGANGLPSRFLGYEFETSEQVFYITEHADILRIVDKRDGATIAEPILSRQSC